MIDGNDLGAAVGVLFGAWWLGYSLRWLITNLMGGFPDGA